MTIPARTFPVPALPCHTSGKVSYHQNSELGEEAGQAGGWQGRAPSIPRDGKASSFPDSYPHEYLPRDPLAHSLQGTCTGSLCFLHPLTLYLPGSQQTATITMATFASASAPHTPSQSWVPLVFFEMDLSKSAQGCTL